MFEEIRESDDPVTDRAAPPLALLQRAVDSAKELLRLGNEGSKIFLVLESDKITNIFQEVTIQLEKALGEIPFDVLSRSCSFPTQVVDMADVDLHRDLLTAYKSSPNSNIDPAMLQRLAKKLQLLTISDLKQESLALHQMVVASDGDPEEITEKMPSLLKKIKDFFMLTQHLQMGKPTYKIPSNERSKPPILPDDFRCHVSLELMKDPAIVSTRQTNDRESIEQWLEEGHDTRPKTQQKLSNKSLTPNYVLHSHSTMVLGQCCLPGALRTKGLLLSSSVSLPSSMLKTVAALLRQVNAFTAVLNLSILEEKKENIVATGAVPAILNVLRRGAIPPLVSLLRNLCIYQGNKVKAARAGLVPILVGLLMDPKSIVLDETLAIVSVLSSHPEGKEAIKATEVFPVLIDVIESRSPRTKEN
ncbi:hypothetical protein ZIOFF_049531 [Zingiber officinale]|uniref:RING-type E3 ubiquitin transferase n=1 Tax=Zingiber officinale TaxID=94328 RepID=A0A8J5FVC0_ZINOF|nr:hypothetical protein ZIOFF_049531 [Zingiber officinale]